VTITPLGTITYRLSYELESSDVESLSLTDFLPLPIFDAAEITSFDITSTPAIPVAGTATFGPADTLHTLA
jgi:hypothetical protein